jgi:hypothetical protein
MLPVRGRGSPLCSEIVICWVFPETSKGKQEVKQMRLPIV